CFRWPLIPTSTSRRSRPPHATSAPGAGPTELPSTVSLTTTAGAPASTVRNPDRSSTREASDDGTRWVLHRHHAVHRVQGVRGGVQGVERRPRRRPEF